MRLAPAAKFRKVVSPSAIFIMPISTLAGTRSAIDSARIEPSEDALRTRRSRKAPMRIAGEPVWLRDTGIALV